MPDDSDAIAALLPIPDEKQRRRCLLLCLQKVRWYQRMRDLDAQRESLEDAREALADLTKETLKLKGIFEMLPLSARLGLISAAEPGEHWKQPFDLLDRRVEMLDQWAAEAQKASASLEKGKPGEPPPELLDWLLREIAVIWEEHTKRRFSRSENRGGAYEFVRALIALCDPKVGSGTLDHAMRRAIGGIRPKENS